MKKQRLTIRLNNYRELFVCQLYQGGLTQEEVSLIFGTTKQNICLILKKNNIKINKIKC